MTTVKHWYVYMAAAVTVAFLVGFFWDQTPIPPNQIPWNSNTSLEWNDFQGTPPQTTPYSAATGYYLGYKDLVWRQYFVDNVCTFVISSVDVDAYVDRTLSWVKDGSQSSELLSHEQGHADILHVKALVLGKALWALVGMPHQCPDNDPAKVQQEVEDMVNSIYNPIFDSHDRLQDEYDSDTDHGRNPDEQRRWNQRLSDIFMPPPPNPIIPL
ncbi:hypothetical protein NZNM25_16750 [Nitrosopumilus zosterae]|uniref:DUF922 domain-containing protein n=1 Tax=Nitrosopumilus zosterae TaxID=718286 RepID=A0A2S2KTB0_9ARCH|nr:DUF922 domain-containing protein [Nitrosopumilus zosterae]BDQ30013.1 DUF922 domain-containing Zn-dependent protease [Nitrosopumilus zosterae]GBH34884.1 hypothetical protein NZNM25_16750 [Nitrosopumilus zosterae]